LPKTLQEWNLNSPLFEIVDVKLDGSEPPLSPFHITPDTLIRVMAEKYRLVFILDMSPTMLSIDVDSKAKVNLSVAFETICKCLDGLSRPFAITSPFGHTIKYEPHLFVSVIADGNMNSENPMQRRIRTLIQDACITRENLNPIFEELYHALNELENEMISLKLTSSPTASGPRGSIFQIFDHALLALDLLPRDAQPGIIFVTDGVSFSRHSEALWRSTSHLPPRLIYGKIALSIIQVNCISSQFRWVQIVGFLQL
jgi:hypothetical protein